MKKAGYTIGAVIILILAAFSFVFTGSLGGCQIFQGKSFGSYDGVNIKYEQNSDFVNYVANYYEYFESQGYKIQPQDEFYIFQNAFNETVKQIAINKSVEKSDYQVPENTVNRVLRNYFTKNGEFDAKEYNQTVQSNPQIIQNLISDIKKSGIINRYREDTFGGIKLGESVLYGLKTSDNEIEFLNQMNKNLRTFNVATFKMSDYPNSEKESYAKENIQKFMKYDLDALTFDSKSKAEEVVSKINKEEITFADALAESKKSYTNENGKLRYEYFYMIEPIFKNSEDAKKLADLKKDSVSSVYETTIGYTIFRANADCSEPDLKNEDVLKTVSTYINQYEFARIQDYYTETAKAFAEVAKSKGFNAATKQFGINSTELKDIALNYGNSSVIKKIDYVEGLYGIETNEDLLKKAFSLNKNEISEPVVLNGNVIVLQFVSESVNPTVVEKDIVEKELVNYDSSSFNYVVLNSPKLKDNFQETYYKEFSK